MKSSIHTRLNRIIGQIQWIQHMMETTQECEKVAIQFKAAKSAFDTAFREFLSDRMKYCVAMQDEVTMEKMLDIIVK